MDADKREHQQSEHGEQRTAGRMGKPQRSADRMGQPQRTAKNEAAGGQNAQRKKHAELPMRMSRVKRVGRMGEPHWPGGQVGKLQRSTTNEIVEMWARCMGCAKPNRGNAKPLKADLRGEVHQGAR